MVVEPSSRRPTCPSCSKPSCLCLCSRIKTPILNNSVRVTILQHSLEQKHPLNSTRIATLGLKNLRVVTVSDVNFEAQFAIQPLQSGPGSGERSSSSCECRSHSKALGFDQASDEERTQNQVLDKIDASTLESGIVAQTCSKSVGHNRKRIRLGTDPLTAFTLQKHGVISSLLHHGIPETRPQDNNFDLFLGSPSRLDELAEGFMVKKWHSRPLQGSARSEEHEEFELEVPPGSALLFPSEQAVSIDAINEVKNLIVLDGTWAKAKRMYKENPWLKLLPHVKLEGKNTSLYSEVRQQPRAGCLSTIESIVYALKAVSDESDTDKLDSLLEVFESMVGDQRRCKNERLNKISSV
ncbi:hypothetical protein NMG60_11037249 [Bertholletia excelsa]